MHNTVGNVDKINYHRQKYFTSAETILLRPIETDANDSTLSITESS